MKYILGTLAFLAIATVIVGVRVIINRREISRIHGGKWHRKAAGKRETRGFIDSDFLRCLGELALLILMLAAVFGWLGYRHP